MAGRKSGAVEWLTKDGLLLLESFARDGLTDKQIAEHKVGVSERTFTANIYNVEREISGYCFSP